MADPTVSAAPAQPTTANGHGHADQRDDRHLDKPAPSAETAAPAQVPENTTASVGAAAPPLSSATGVGEKAESHHTDNAAVAAADDARADTRLSAADAPAAAEEGAVNPKVEDTTTSNKSTPAPFKDTTIDQQKDEKPDIAMTDTTATEGTASAATAAATAPDATKPAETPATADVAAPAADDAKKADASDEKEEAGAGAETTKPADDAAGEDKKEDASAGKEDKETKDNNDTGAAASAAPAATETTPAKPAKSSSSSLSRRKSVGQKLNRKGSKARMVHLDAKPGEHYFVKLKGYPAWPVVVCDEDMLPQTLIKTRPVTAARPDGTYREDYADGGRRAADRTFPVMYLHTNEFGWVPNQDMHDLDPEKVLDSVNDKMRKDLQRAHQLAAENNPLSYYKDMLRQFQEELEQAEEAKRQALATPKKSGSKKASKDEDIDMLDVPEDDDEAEAPAAAQKKSKKRKAEDDVRTPQRSDSVKKPKIKITSSGTPKSGSAGANGTPATSKSAKAAASSDAKSSSKSKSKSAGETKAAATKEAAKEAAAPEAPREPVLSADEKRRRRAKEVLFLRHKIQKGLLTRNQAPKEEEMKPVSEYLTKLEGFADLEASIIRETKINKVLKTILKIADIPREEEFKFKPRSQALLDKWNVLLAAEPAPEPKPTEAKTEDAPANGVSTNGKAETKSEAKADTNGVHDKVEKAEKAEKASEEAKSEAKAGPDSAEEADKPKEAPATVEATA
ncbi:pre-mRNA splicing factor [Niveomyces insectorum RCEF 264]|uniref:Pre-mRNA splicing factor n=1 Tax=Niveomyces insectorum RCEF 264 TaxID=1081102 RepID=A0A162J4Q2_9HYPO|nr:pre-mRNA splicing factor [Niveomyces insectorum RCEF 264]